jgi:predicted site-specific integrase-resolvase
MFEDTQDTGIGSKPDVTLRERELAERWKLSTRTLQRWRAEGFGPAYILIGGTVRYRISDVLDYENQNERGGRS